MQNGLLPGTLALSAKFLPTMQAVARRSAASAQRWMSEAPAASPVRSQGDAILARSRVEYSPELLRSGMRQSAICAASSVQRLAATSEADLGLRSYGFLDLNLREQVWQALVDQDVTNCSRKPISVIRPKTGAPVFMNDHNYRHVGIKFVLSKERRTLCSLLHTQSSSCRAKLLQTGRNSKV